MHLHKISWKNIGPFGNKLQTIEFPSKGGLWMITGKNGNGKSFFLNLPKILYYGKLDKFKKDEIANRINRDGWISGIDEIYPGTFVTIERSFSPTNLKVAKGMDDKIPEDIGKAGISNYQDYIDLEVTGLPYHIFSNIISLSINDFKSFISMTPHDKRVIIDKLFDMEIINRMNELVKKDLRDIKMNMDSFNREILSLKNNIDVAVKELKNLNEQVTQDNSAQIEILMKKLEEYKPELERGYAKKKEWEEKRNEIIKSQNIFIKQKAKVTHEIENIEEKINLFFQDKCPTCETPFTDTRFQLIKGQLQEDIAKKKEELSAMKNDENKYNDTLEKIKTGLSTINNFIIKYQSSYNSINDEIKRLKITKTKEFSSIKNIIANNTASLTSKNEEKAKYDEEFKYLSILEQLYSDSGVKKKILESYIPTLNKEIAITLHDLHFPYTLTFDSEFEPTLYHLGVKIGEDTLSTGEKKRVDLAILISIIRMIKRKYPSLNIFMLDEVLSSIDGDGIYDIIGILKKITEEMNINIFIINHSHLPIEQFDFRIEIKKDNGFSDLEIEKFNRED